jgi:Rps23 Pro-64 3,4-dihydroxylase Tpa1-like proline 4-hydroxylase
MDINSFEISGLPVLIIDNFYDDEDCDKIWKELCFLNSNDDKLKGPEETGSALRKSDMMPLKKNRGRFLEKIYYHREMSDILTCNRKIFSEEFVKKITERHYFFDYISESTCDSTLVQYYENDDYYDFHKDSSTITCLSWFFDQPKKFSGGNLILQNVSGNDLEIECTYNRTVIIPSIISHQVTKTTLDENLIGKNCGRYAIAQFITSSWPPNIPFIK